MAKSSYYLDVDSAAIKNILTLRYNPALKTMLPKLTWTDFVEKQDEIHPVEFVEKSIVELLRQKIGSVKRVALALSGGVDSTLMLAILRKTFPSLKIEAISIRFANSVDETSQAANIASRFDANHHILDLENYLAELPEAISIIKQPFWDLHWYHVVKKAKSFSDVLVSGDGGDELFGGYTFRYQKFLSLVSNDSSPQEKVIAYLQCHERDWVPDQEKVFGEKAPFSWEDIYNQLKIYFDNSLHPLSQVFLADYNGKLLYNWVPLYDSIHKHFGVNAIAPLLSDNLISFAPHIPNAMKYDSSRNTGKIVLRSLLKRYLGTQEISSAKQGFSVNTLNLWKDFGYDICNYYLSDARICKDGWINPTWIKEHMGSLEGESGMRYVNKFMGLLALEVWYRMFVTNELKSSSLLH